MWKIIYMVFLDPKKELENKNFWQSLAPKLHIESETSLVEPMNLAEKDSFILQDEMTNQGYSHIENEDFKIQTKELAAMVKLLVAKKILPVFLAVYDEFWMAQASLAKAVEPLLGKGYKLRPCFWTWHLDPQKEEEGWSAHRDGFRDSLDEKFNTKVLTTWIPLSDANPLNGCMYMVPMDRSKPNQDPKILDFKLSEIRALPAKAGDIFFWNHWVIHWGAKASKKAKEARMSMAFEFEKQGSNILDTELLDPMRLPSFAERLQLIAKQILQYKHMYEFTQEMVDFAEAQMALVKQG